MAPVEVRTGSVRTAPAALLVLLVIAGVIAAFIVTASTGPARFGGDTPGPLLLVPSPAWQNTVDEATARQRTRDLVAGITRLRDATGSGWTGRQDDITGWLAELSGGSFRADDEPGQVAASFLADHAPELFGVPGDTVQVPGDFQVDATGRVVLRADQRVDDVRVVDGVLSIAVEDAETGSPRLTAVRGRVFPGVADVDTDPRLSADEAVTAAEEGTRGSPIEDPELVVLPVDGAGVLAWRVVVAGAQGTSAATSEAFVDANDGTLVSLRPASTTLVPQSQAVRGAVAQAGQAGEPVQLTGTDPQGRQVTATGTRLPDGTIALIDPTTPWYANGTGALEIHEGAGVNDPSGLPGPAKTGGSTQIADSDAIGALAFSRYVVDYYLAVFGRSSWDGRGGTLRSTVNFGPSDFCNAFFSGTQMVYGDSCVLEGAPRVATFVDIDIAGHEITHGITATTADLRYSGQPGALNESFSDYFGNLMGNHYQQDDDATLGEGACVGLQPTPPFCTQQPEGDPGSRYLLNGNTFADYLYLLDPAVFLKVVFEFGQDHGGVHLNSAIWNNALWSTRKRLADMDGTTMRESPRAQQFDIIVYRALTEHLTPGAGFLDARAAVEAAAQGADGVIVGVIREVMDLNRICAGCTPLAHSEALPVTLATVTERDPAFTGDGIVWMEYAGDESAGSVIHSRGGQARRLADVAGSAAPAGDAVIAIQETQQGIAVVRHDPAGGAQTLGPAAGQNQIQLLFLIAGSDDGAAWISDSLNYVDAAGQVTTAPLPGNVEPTALGAGGGAVAVGTRDGQVLWWQPGGSPTPLTAMQTPVVALDVYGTRVFAVAADGSALLIDATSGQATRLSDNASPFGASLNGQYAVWSERVGALAGGVAANLQSARGQAFADTDLYLYSTQTGVTYKLLERRGQQGYPSIDSSNRVAWTDAAHGGNDVYAGVIPAGY